MKFTPGDSECDPGGVTEIILARTRVSGSVSRDVVAMVPWDGYGTVDRNRGSVARNVLLSKVTGDVVAKSRHIWSYSADVMASLFQRRISTLPRRM